MKVLLGIVIFVVVLGLLNWWLAEAEAKYESEERKRKESERWTDVED